MSQQQYFDTYFLDPKTALQTALQKNKVFAPNGIVSSLQICYYGGNKIDDAPINCIHVQFDSIVDYFSTTKNRLPKVIDSTNINLSSNEISNLKDLFQKSMDKVREILNNKIKELQKDIKNLKPDFKDKELRIFAHGCKETILIKYFVKGIIDAADKLGHKTHLHTQISDIESCSQVFYLQALKDFNPHITININHLNNEHISDDVFNFIWFQDYVPMLRNDAPIDLRERDFVFHLIDVYGEILNRKNVKSKYQPFCIDANIFKERTHIKKEKKIVFIGSSYASYIDKIKDDDNYEKIYKAIVEEFEKKSCLKGLKHQDSDIRNLINKFNKPNEFITDIYHYVQRDYCVEKLCQIDTDYTIEIYGNGWEDNPIVKPFSKGSVEYGEDISKIYNSATYGYCPGGYIFMHRTLECAMSGTIPLVLDSRLDMQDFYDKESEKALEFFSIKDLETILKKEPKKNKNFDYIRANFGYNSFVEKCVDIVKNTIIGDIK